MKTQKLIDKIEAYIAFLDNLEHTCYSLELQTAMDATKSELIDSSMALVDLLHEDLESIESAENNENS